MHMLTRDKLFPIGIGTWGIGGLDKRNPDNNDKDQISGMVYALKQGENFIEANLWYADGYSAQLTAEAVKRSGKKRDEIFLSQTVYTQSAPGLGSAREEWKIFTDLFKTDYVDTFQFSLKNFITYGKEQSVNLLTELLSSNKTRYVSITNSDLETLVWFRDIFIDKVFSHELIYNFEIRTCEDIGVLKYSDNNHILNVIAQPLRRNRTVKHNWPLLKGLSDKYHRTQNQIILNWLVSEGYLVITKATDISHIDENIKALYFQMTKEDLKLMHDFRVPNFVSPETDWNWTGKGIPAHMVPNIFDDEYAKQNP